MRDEHNIKIVKTNDEIRLKIIIPFPSSPPEDCWEAIAHGITFFISQVLGCF
jgi:hypothetical protein